MNSVMTIQNLVLNHESQPIKSSPVEEDNDDTEWRLEGDFERNAFHLIIDNEQY